MDGKVILKASLITFGALIAAAALTFTLWFFIAPKSMASISQQWGYYDFALTCGNKQYKKSQKTEDLAFCAEISIYISDDGKIVEFCEPLIEKEDFNTLCRQKDEQLSKTQYSAYATNYHSYILGNLAVSQYRLGDLHKAVTTVELGIYSTDDPEIMKEYLKRLILEVVLHGSEEDKVNISSYPKQPEVREYIASMVELLSQQ